MKKVIKALTVLSLITVAFASPVFAEWIKVGKNVSGDTWYIDHDTVKENNGYVYHWELQDRLKPNKYGDLSVKVLSEADCDIPRKYRYLSQLYYTQPMASGSTSTTNNDTSEWKYPSPNSVGEAMINAACDYAGK